MRGDKVKSGDVVTYRGREVPVVKAWTTAKGAPKGIPYPVGCVLQLEPPSEDHPRGVCVYLGWPCAEPVELQRGDRRLFGRHDDDPATAAQVAKVLKARLAADLEAFPIEAL